MMSYTREYRIWWDMNNRCLKPKTKRYESYGGRGIKVCSEWLNFENFFRDMGHRPTPKHSLDRINNDGNYCKENCRWATAFEQTRNRRTNIYLLLEGEKMILKEVNKKLNISTNAIRNKVRKLKISHQEALDLILQKVII